MSETIPSAMAQNWLQDNWDADREKIEELWNKLSLAIWKEKVSKLQPFYLIQDLSFISLKVVRTSHSGGKIILI